MTDNTTRVYTTESITEGLKENRRAYARFPEALRRPAVEMLRAELKTVADQIRAEIVKDPIHWVAPYHFGWGMTIRNLMRTKGFGEDYWPVDNLDDIYAACVEEAIMGKPTDVDAPVTPTRGNDDILKELGLDGLQD